MHQSGATVSDHKAVHFTASIPLPANNAKCKISFRNLKRMTPASQSANIYIISSLSAPPPPPPPAPVYW